MNFSRYAHFFNVAENTIGLYHSLLIKTVFVEKNEFENIKLYFETGKFTDKETEETVKHLYQNYFIVKLSEEDKNLYDKCVDLIFPPAIANTYVVVTENCNFNCNYCFISDAVNSEKEQKTMPKEVAEASVELLQRTYERQKNDYDKTITFYGGEPLLNFEAIKCFIREIETVKQSKYWPDDVKYSIITNGSLLSSEIINFLKSHNISLGISYDVDEISHSNRILKNNEDTFEIVKEKINLCKKMEMPFNLSITITESTIKNREKILENILAIRPFAIAFSLLMPNKKMMQNHSYYEKATDFMIEAFKVLRKFGIYENRVMRKVQAFSNNKLYLYDCCASGGNQYVISPDGNIGICHGYLNNRKYFSSDVFDRKFDYLKDGNFNYWQKRTPLLMRQCQDCECLGICGGGCPYSAEYANGSIYDLDERFCIHAKKMLKWLINDLYNGVKAYE